MNNEPVAWMREDGVIAFHKQKEVDSQGYKWQPLYTHPIELTDNEIVWLWCDCEKDGTEATYIKFARAILTKAQKK